MTDRELWVKTCKTVGAMTGGTLVLLGSMSLLVMLVVGRPVAASASDTPSAPTAVQGGDGKVDTTSSPPPMTPRPRRHGAAASAAPGESI